MIASQYCELPMRCPNDSDRTRVPNPGIPSLESGHLNNSMAAADRQRDPEACAPLGARADVDAPVVRVDDLADDRQSEPGALRLGREERTEDPLHHVRRNARAVVADLDLDHRHRRARRRRRLLFGRQLLAPRSRPCPSPPSASKALVSRFVKSCRSWCGSPWIGAQVLREHDLRPAPGRAATWLSAIEIASRTTSASETRSTCSRIGRTKSRTSSTMALAILASLMMSREDRLRVRRLGQLPLQDPGHHLDAGERVLDLVRDRRRHLAERRQPVAQPLALLELLDARQILEEERRAGDAPAGVADLRQRVADDLARCSSAAARRGWAGATARTRPRRSATTSGWSFRTSVNGRPMSVVRGCSARIR